MASIQASLYSIRKDDKGATERSGQCWWLQTPNKSSNSLPSKNLSDDGSTGCSWLLLDTGLPAN